MRDDISTLFHESTPPSMSLDPYAVLAGGRRRRRRRVALTGSALTALAVVAVAVAASGLGSGRPTALPANSSSPGLPVSVTLGGTEPMLDNQGHAIPGPSRFAVEIDPTRPDNLGYYAVDGSGTRTLIARSDVTLPVAPTGAGPVTWGTGSAAPHVVLGVLPAAATSWMLANPSATSGSHSDQATLGVTGLQAFVSVYDNATDAAKATGVIWRDAAGSVWDQSGPVPSASLDADTVAFVDARLDLWGDFTATGSMSAPIPTTAKPDVTWSGGDQRVALSGGDQFTPAVHVGLVPLRASRPEATFAPGCSQRVGPTLIPAGDGLHAFLYASCVPASASTNAITGLSVVVDGTRISS